MFAAPGCGERRLEGYVLMEKRRQWQFQMTVGDEWLWQVSDVHGTRDSSRTFATLKECTANAMEHGYVAWKPENERRESQALDIVKVLAPQQNKE
jgi:hypothetical protein